MSEWNGEERRKTRDFNVRVAIIDEIAKTSDQTIKTILLLMLALFEYQEDGLLRIERKIDAVLRDDKQIKALALDCHMEKHHEHHDWIETQMVKESDRSPVCEWSKAKMAEDLEVKKSKKSISQKFLEGAAAHAGSVIAGGILMWIAVHFLKGF